MSWGGGGGGGNGNVENVGVMCSPKPHGSLVDCTAGALETMVREGGRGSLRR